MPIKRIDELPEGSGSLSSDDVFLFMDDPSGSGVTKKISLSEIATAIGGGTSFVIGNIDLHNGGIQSAQILQFNDASKQSVITGPTPAENSNAQRLIIQGQRGTGIYEGGDVYLWGGDSDINGGDIKIYAGDADSNESGNGGYVNIDGGNGYTQGGNVSISAGNSSTQGGNVNISAGYPSGNVSINTNAGSWAFNTDGTVDLPSFTLDAGLNSLNLKSSSAYVQLNYQSGPSGTSDNYIEIPNNNSEAYLWTTYDGTHIENVRANDGTNPSWDYEWHFRNDGKLEHPDGTTNSGGTVIAPGTYNIQSIDNTLLQTSANAQAKSWNFETNGNLTLPQGSILSETNNTLSIAPPTAQSGQSLVVRPTAAIWAISSSNYIEYGNPITIVVTLQNWAYFGTVNYTISGPGVTLQSLGRALTGKLTFVSTTGPEAESITWTIPANSNISEFTLTLTSVDGTRSTDEQTQNDPALYYDFEENAMPIGQFITVTNNGISSSEHSHVHLVAGDPSTVDIYLGDDDQYVKIQKNGGNVVIGTDNNNNHWTFGTNGRLTLPIDGDILDSNGTSVLGGGGSTTVVQLGSVSGTINTNATLGDIFDLTLASSGILANPSGSVDGQSLRWRISYANSGIPLTLGNNFRIPSSASSPLPFSTSSGTMDMLGATYDSSRNKWDVIAFVPGY